MNVLIFEWLNGGGCWLDKRPPNFDCPFERQGSMMLEAITSDFLDAGCKVTTFLDQRIKSQNFQNCELKKIGSAISLQTQIRDQAKTTDAILLIAPETNHCLSTCLSWVKDFREKLISPDVSFVNLTSNKQATCDWLRKKEVPVPKGIVLMDLLKQTAMGQVFQSGTKSISINPFVCPIQFPAAIKPIDGAGSEHVLVVNSENEIPDSARIASDQFRIEEFVQGIPVSVSVIAGKNANHILQPTKQCFADPITADDAGAVAIGEYRSADFELAKIVQERALDLARKTLAALPATRGYFGVDMVIGNDVRSDVVVEVNPRLTCSYVWLREKSKTNLAQLMLDQIQTEKT